MHSSSTNIYHEGIVDNLDQHKVLVRIVAQSACSSCHSKGMCSALDMKEKLIEVKRNRNLELNAGDKVILQMRTSLGHKAVVLGYLLPFLLVIITLIVASSFFNEAVSGAIAIGMLLPYYLLLYLFRNQMRKTFQFELKQKTDDFTYLCHP